MAVIAKLTLLALSLAGIVAGCELGLRKVYGLGDPVLYDNNPLYGYRPLPNQDKPRFRGAVVRTNNLGLRCDQDWDANPAGKALFLGDSITYGGSYISNHELFSALAVEGTGYASCNGGVNAWGVENIAGLVVDSGFQPAALYVTTIPEGDFYRGLTRLQGMPYFNVKPSSALEELLQFLAYRLMNRRYVGWDRTASESLKRQVVEQAVQRLAEMDERLRERGFAQLVFITPTRSRLLAGGGPDPLVRELLDKHGIAAVDIADELEVAREQRDALYVDDLHLSVAGHRLWADVIRKHLPHIRGED